MLPVWLDVCRPHRGEGSSLGLCGRSDERGTFLLPQIKKQQVYCLVNIVPLCGSISIRVLEVLQECMSMLMKRGFFFRGQKVFICISIQPLKLLRLWARQFFFTAVCLFFHVRLDPARSTLGPVVPWPGPSGPDWFPGSVSHYVSIKDRSLNTALQKGPTPP